MSLLDVLDATNICSQWSGPQAWAIDIPAAPRPPLPPAPADFSWWSLVRNPQALLLTGVVAAGLVRDNVLRPKQYVRLLAG